MRNDDHGRTIDELDRLLNDPTVPMQPNLIWHLVEQISEREAYFRSNDPPQT